MAAAPKTIKDASGAIPKSAAIGYGPPATPPDQGTIEAALLQLQNTVNEIISRYNSHVHVENTAGAYTQNANTAVPTQLVTGTPVGATNLFTNS